MNLELYSEEERPDTKQDGDNNCGNIKEHMLMFEMSLKIQPSHFQETSFPSATDLKIITRPRPKANIILFIGLRHPCDTFKFFEFFEFFSHTV